MSINIVLSNTDPLFPEGIVEGNVVCVFNTRTEIRGIRMTLKGREHNSWHKQESRYDSSSKKTERISVYYLGDKIFLVIEQDVFQGGEVNTGKHEYPFRLVLPKNIPSTYKGVHGFVKYYLKAKMLMSAAPELVDEKDLLVKSPIDLNDMLDHIVLNPMQYEDETNLCCCCIGRGLITMRVHVNKGAFALGEIIQTQVYVKNMANQTVSQLRVELRRTIKERCTNPKSDGNFITDTILQSVNAGVGAHGDKTYRFELIIPTTLELPNFTNCQLFSQSFTLKFVASLPGCHQNLVLEFGITLGHFPVRNRESLQNTTQGGQEAGNIIQGTKNLNSDSSGSSAPPTASAPIDDAAASAPLINDFTIGDNFLGVSDLSIRENTNPLPPSYSEAMRN